MAFYNPNGFVLAFQHAKEFAGEDGHVATIPDIIAARLASKPGDCSWENYFTTMSAEYVGLSKNGNPIVIVAHGIGPMSTLDGVLKAYSYEFNDKDRNRRGGRISQEIFLQLESGYFGEVSIIDLTDVWARRPYQFSGHPITSKEIMEEPLWQARLGKQWEKYVKYHSEFSNEYHREKNDVPYKNPCILAMDDASNCAYSSREMFDYWMEKTPNTAIAHLLSIGGLSYSHHQYYEYDYSQRENRISMSSDVSCHEWWNGTRLLGIQPTDTIIVHPGLPEYEKIIETNIDKLWKDNPKGSSNSTEGFWHLVQINNLHFTDYPKQGERMDNYEPEFLVTEIEKVSKKQKFRTTIGGYHGFFKYGIKEVETIAPPEANAYTINNAEVEWTAGNPTHHIAIVTFYKIKIDATRRLVRMGDIYRDFDLMMSLIN